MATAEIVKKVKRCREIVKDLKKLDIISVDAEGINLGKDGPLTLLQIGTTDGRVYLFDVLANKFLFDKGELKEVLQSDSVVKVMHSSRGDSAALYFQCDVQLENVFDTQIAHLIIEEHTGRKLPKRIKLADLCSKYSTGASVSEEKALIKDVYAKEKGRFWAVRPLTDEMIAYAAGDVTALIPDVYQTLKTYLAKHDLFGKFTERVNEEVNYAIDKRMSRQHHKRQAKIVREIVELLPGKYHCNVKFLDITDEDDISAIQKLKLNTPNLLPMISRLKTEAIKQQLTDLDSQLTTEKSNFMPKCRSYSFLRTYQNHSDDNIKQDSQRILRSINNIILEDIVLKYETGTDFEDLALNEKEALNTLRPKTVHDKNIHPKLLDVYWKMKEANLDATISVFREKREDYTIPENFYKWIKYCCRGRVPENMKLKARQLVRNLDRTFGRGVVPGAQSDSD